LCIVIRLSISSRFIRSSGVTRLRFVGQVALIQLVIGGALNRIRRSIFNARGVGLGTRERIRIDWSTIRRRARIELSRGVKSVQDWILRRLSECRQDERSQRKAGRKCEFHL
jgi:hypothetical protein